MWEAAVFGGKYFVSDADPEAMHLLLIGLLHVQPHIIYHAKQFTLLHQKKAMRWARRMAGQVGFFLLSLFIFVLDKSYFCVLPLFISLSSFHCISCIFPSPSLSIFFSPSATFMPSIIAHLFEKASDWGLWRPDGIVIRERDRQQRTAPPPNKRTLARVTAALPRQRVLGDSHSWLWLSSDYACG